MTKTEFDAWARGTEKLREQALEKYKSAKDKKAKEAIVKKLDEQLNQA